MIKFTFIYALLQSTISIVTQVQKGETVKGKIKMKKRKLFFSCKGKYHEWNIISFSVIYLMVDFFSIWKVKENSESLLRIVFLRVSFEYKNDLISI